MTSSTSKPSQIREWFADNNLWILCAYTSIAAGLLFSFALKDFVWFQYSGAFVACIGAVMLVRPLVIGVPKVEPVYQASGYSDTDMRHYIKSGEQVPDVIIQNNLSDESTGYGAVFSVFGVLSSSFGKLLNQLLVFF